MNTTETTDAPVAQAEKLGAGFLSQLERDLKAMLHTLPAPTGLLASRRLCVWLWNDDSFSFYVNTGKGSDTLAEAIAEASPEKERARKLAEADELRAQAAKLEEEAAS